MSHVSVLAIVLGEPAILKCGETPGKGMSLPTPAGEGQRSSRPCLASGPRKGLVPSSL